MNPLDKQIAELFDVGTDPELVAEIVPEAVGATSEESRRMGEEALNEGQFDAALAQYQRAIEEQGLDEKAVVLELAAIHEAMDQSPKALQLYLKAKRTHDDPNIQLAVSEIYRRVGRTKKAIEELREGLEERPDHAYGHYKMAEACRSLKLYEAAAIAIQNAIVFAAADWFYYYWQADLLVEMRRFPQAIESIRGAIDLSPGDDHLYLLAALAFWGNKQQDQAVKATRLASELSPDKHLYHGLLYRFLDAMGSETEATQELVRAKKMDEFDQDQLARLLEPVGLNS